MFRTTAVTAWLAVLLAFFGRTDPRAFAQDAGLVAHDPFAERPYYDYSTHADMNSGLAAPRVAATEFVAPEIIGAAPPAPVEPIGPPEFEAGLSDVVTPTYAVQPQRTALPPEWHLLPGDVLYKSLIAGVHAPRMGAELVGDQDQGGLLDVSIGGRIPVIRKGTVGPEASGWELQVYGAAFSRLSMDRESDVEATDYAFGIPIVWRRGATAVSIGYDHLSSHIGDEYLIKNPGFRRVNYVRDSIELAVMQDLTESVSVYGEVNRTFHGSGGSEPWHFQLGAEYEPPVAPGWRGAPVAAVNTLLRQEFDYEGSLGVVAGWQWRGLASDDLLRLGLTLYTGRSRQFSFYDRYEKLFGAGIWYDF